MPQTIQSLIDHLQNDYAPTDFVEVYLWTKSDIAERFPDGQEITNDEVKQVLNNFSFSDYIWDGISENFSNALDSVLGEFRCDECGDYDKEVEDIDGQATCRGCGEEKEIV